MLRPCAIGLKTNKYKDFIGILLLERLNSGEVDVCKRTKFHDWHLDKALMEPADPTENLEESHCTSLGESKEDYYKDKENALVVWPGICSSLKSKGKRRFAIFLDYDGTLTPIVDTPSKATLPTDMRQVVERLSKKYFTAIVTGRRYETIYNFVKLDSLYYAGSHGFDIRRPNQPPIKQVGGDYLPSLAGFCAEITKSLKHIQGALVEDNLYCITIHYRNVDPELVPVVQEILLSELVRWPKLERKFGKKVIEVRPAFQWDKGKAVQWLLDEMFENEKKKEKKKKNKGTTRGGCTGLCGR